MEAGCYVSTSSPLVDVKLSSDDQGKAVDPSGATAGNAHDAVSARWDQGVPVHEHQKLEYLGWLKS